MPGRTKVFVGNLDRDRPTSESELEKAFNHYGTLKSVWVARNPPGFAFVDFDDEQDAEDAIRGLDGSDLCGARIKVELATERPPRRGYGGGRGGGYSGGGYRGSRGGGGGFRGGRRGGFNSDDKCYECGERGHYSYDCPQRGGGGRRDDRRRSRSRSRSGSH